MLFVKSKLLVGATPVPLTNWLAEAIFELMFAKQIALDTMLNQKLWLNLSVLHPQRMRTPVCALFIGFFAYMLLFVLFLFCFVFCCLFWFCLFVFSCCCCCFSTVYYNILWKISFIGKNNFKKTDEHPLWSCQIWSFNHKIYSIQINKLMKNYKKSVRVHCPLLPIHNRPT